MKNWNFQMLATSSTSKFFRILKAIENWDDWVLKRNHRMNKSEWKLEVFNWIFNALRTANLNIFFDLVEWIIYHFRRVNSNNSKDWMIMVMINWLKLLAVSEKSSHTFFNQKADSVWSITLGCTNKNMQGPIGTYTKVLLLLYFARLWF